MIQKALEYLVKLGAPTIVKSGDREYSDRPLNGITDPTPKPLAVNTLAGVVAYLSDGPDFINFTGAIHIQGHDNVSVISALHLTHFMERSEYLHAHHAPPVFNFGSFYDTESFIIALQSMFVQDETTAAILKIVGNLKTENSVITKDDGISQEVTAKQGISMVQQVQLPNPVTLRPFRTFREIDQPVSTFVLRMKAGGGIALFEADGKMWQLEAIDGIKKYLSEKLPEVAIIA